MTADQGINLTLLGLLIKVDAVGVQRLARRLGRGRLFLGVLLARAFHRAGFRSPRLLGDTVGDEVHRVIAGHVLLLQEVGGVAFPFGEDGHQHIGPGHLFAAGGLHMDHRALDHPLEAGGRLGVLAILHHQRLQLGVQIVQQVLLEGSEIDLARPHDARGVRIVGKGQQQMLKRGVLMLALVGELDGLVKRVFQIS